MDVPDRAYWAAIIVLTVVFLGYSVHIVTGIKSTLQATPPMEECQKHFDGGFESANYNVPRDEWSAGMTAPMLFCNRDKESRVHLCLDGCGSVFSWYPQKTK